MNFIYDKPEDILNSRTILCSECAIILAHLYKKQAEPIGTNLILTFECIQANSIKEEFYLIDIKHHPQSSDEEIRDCLNKIFQNLQETLKEQNSDVTLKVQL